MSIDLKPREEIVELLKYKSKGNVLDLGCGNGKNALFLATNGFNVTAIDSSEKKIKNLVENAKNNNIKLNAKVGDIRNLIFDETYDIIIVSYVLSFLTKEVVISLIKRIKEATNENGINVILAFTVKDPFFNKEMAFFELDELKINYSDWEIIKYEEKLLEPETHGGKIKEHQHHVVSIIAQNHHKV